MSAVALAVEVLGLQALVDDQRVERAVGEQDRAEDGLLGLERVGGARRRSRGGAGATRRTRSRPVESSAARGGMQAPLRALPASSAQMWRSGVGRGYFCSVTMVLIVAVTPSATSTTTM